MLQQLTKIRNLGLMKVIVAIFITLFCLYIFGNAGQIVGYKNNFYLPSIKLLFFHLFILVTMSISNYYLIDEFLHFKIGKNLLIIFIGIVSAVLALFSLPMRTNFLIPLGYVPIGEYLRDVHGINWFFMDWAGWSITMSLYLTSMYAALILKLMNTTLLKRTQKKK
jgi:hypothetical protein